jgi:hypothetical protein
MDYVLLSEHRCPARPGRRISGRRRQGAQARHGALYDGQLSRRSGFAQSKNATLSIMVGGPEATFNRVKPLFDVMARTSRWLAVTVTVRRRRSRIKSSSRSTSRRWRRHCSSRPRPGPIRQWVWRYRTRQPRRNCSMRAPRTAARRGSIQPWYGRSSCCPISKSDRRARKRRTRIRTYERVVRDRQRWRTAGALSMIIPRFRETNAHTA